MLTRTINGTGAGRKRDHSPYVPWECKCPHPIWKGEKQSLPGYVKHCVDCEAKRP